jgi:hypothetical protein
MSLSAYALLYGLEPQPAALGAYMGGVFGFLDPEHLLAHRLPAKGTSAAFETVDLHGQVLDTWTVPKHWTIVDISPDKRRLAVVPDEHFSKTLVVDYPSMNVVLKKGNPYGADPEVLGSFSQRLGERCVRWKCCHPTRPVRRLHEMLGRGYRQEDRTIW